jgi:flavodoxin
MKAMVVYDSQYGNTGQVAQAIGQALGTGDEVQVKRVTEAKPEQLAGLDLLIAGSPTQAFTATSGTKNYLKAIPDGGLQGVKVAAFDTRFTEEAINRNRFLAFMVRIFGYAAQPIADRLVKKGGELAVPPEAFYVGDTEGPLLEGELERAAEWAAQVADSL